MLIRRKPVRRPAVPSVVAAMVVALVGVLLGNSLTPDGIFFVLQMAGFFDPAVMHVISVLTWPWIFLNFAWVAVLALLALAAAALATTLIARQWLSRTADGVFPIVWLSTVLGASVGEVVRLAALWILSPLDLPEITFSLSSLVSIPYVLGWGMAVGPIAGLAAAIVTSSHRSR